MTLTQINMPFFHRTEDAIFFVFDNDRLKDENDFVEDGILYFSPFGMEKSEKYGLVSQLIGISRFLQMTFGSPASVYCLQDAKVAFRHIEHYTLGLSGKVYCSSSHLLDLLNRLVEMFRFYRGGFHILEKVCIETGKDFSVELQMSWDCFTAFVKRYGDTVSSYFQSLPILKVSKEIELEVFIQSAHLLEEVCRMVPGAKSGCLLYDNQVCYSQLTPNLTSKFAIVRPKQHNLPCQLLPTDLELQGVRLFKVYLTQDEFLSLGNVRQFPSVLAVDSSFCPKKRSSAAPASNDDRTSATHFSHTEPTLTDSKFHVNHEEHRKTYHVTDCDSGDGIASEVAATDSRSMDGAQLVNGKKEPASEQLVELEMFVQGTSDSVFILLMESGALSDEHILKTVWKHVLLCISEVEGMIRGTACSSANDVESKSSRDSGHYLTFNNATGDLSGDLLQPVTSQEHNFYQAAQLMHEEFKVDVDTVEITLRTRQAVFTGLQNGYDELFCWSADNPMKPGLPSVTADDNTEQLIRKLKDIKLGSS